MGEFLNDYDNVKLITVGNLAKYISQNTTISATHFNNNLDCAKYLAQNIEKDSIVLFKASRSMKFEEIIEGLKKL
jgi:UDP-N-acetylmuramoyl-tripeptide--D-alanyl-D-alanine ligase